MKKTLALVLCMLFVSAFAVNKASAGSNTLYFFAGGVNVLTEPDITDMGEIEVAEFGPAFGVQYMANIVPMFGIGIDGMYNMFGGKEYTVGADSLEFKPTIGTVMLVAKLSPFPVLLIRPYAMAGIGWNFLRITMEGTIGGTSFSESEDSNGYVICIGAGADIVLGNLIIGAEGRWHQAAVNFDDDITEDDINYYSILAKVGFKFGN